MPLSAPGVPLRRRAMLHLKDNKTPLTCLAFSPDAGLLVTGGHRGTVQLWDPVAGTLKAKFCRSYTAVKGLYFLEGQELLVLDHTTRIWQLQPLQRTHENWTIDRDYYISSIAAAPDGVQVCIAEFD